MMLRQAHGARERADEGDRHRRDRDAMSPCCAAMTLIESGRSGRNPALRDTSAITGSSA